LGRRLYLKVVCAWCGKLIKEKKPLDNKSITHSICRECSRKLKDEIKGLEELIDKSMDKDKKTKK
jgi:hypothetical protein